MDKNVWNRVAVWRAMDVFNATELEKFMLEDLGVKVKFIECVTTLPSKEDEEGGRFDVLFYIHDQDIQSFTKRKFFLDGCDWFEEVVDNSPGIYPKEIKSKYYWNN